MNQALFKASFALLTKNGEINVKSLWDTLQSENAQFQLPQQLDSLFLKAMIIELLSQPEAQLVINYKVYKPLDYQSILNQVLIKVPIDPKLILIKLNSGNLSALPPPKKILEDWAVPKEVESNPYECDVKLLEQFYKREENIILFQVYEIICNNQTRDLVYSEICSKFNEKYASKMHEQKSRFMLEKIKKRCAVESQKLTTLDIAHFCKKLEKLGFVSSANNQKTSEKRISLRQIEYTAFSKLLYKPDWTFISQPIGANAGDEEEDNMLMIERGQKSKRKRTESEGAFVKQYEEPLETIQEMREVAMKRQILTHQNFQVPKLTMREGILRVLEQKIDPTVMRALDHQFEAGNLSSDDENQSNKDGFCAEVSIYEAGKFTISDIASALGMAKEEKTLSRVLNELKKSHPRIQQSAVRNGRIFQYKYYLKGALPQSVLVSRNPSACKNEIPQILYWNKTLIYNNLQMYLLQQNLYIIVSLFYEMINYTIKLVLIYSIFGFWDC